MSITLFSQQNIVHKIAHSIYSDQHKDIGSYSSRAISMCTAPAAAREKAATAAEN